jgi:hypothetical protein
MTAEWCIPPNRDDERPNRKGPSVLGLWRVSLLGAALGLVATAAPSLAADHNDPVRVQATGTTTGDPAPDIADIFAYYRGPTGKPNSVVLTLTWRVDPLAELAFDPTIRYGIHVDNDASFSNLAEARGIGMGAEFDIWIWFGKKKGTANEWGVYLENVPGLGGKKVAGDVGKVLKPAPGVQIMAGLADDPFFFDLDGFFAGLSVALGNPAGDPSFPAGKQNTISPFDATKVPRPFGFVNTSDGFGRTNVHFVAIEVPAAAVLKGTDQNHRDLHIWATTDGKVGRKTSGRVTSP